MDSKKAAEGGQRALKALASQLEKTVALWRNRLRDQTAVRNNAPATDIGVAQSDLRQQLTALERDGTAMQEDLERELAAAAEWEQRAMTAVEDRDDYAAREALERQERHSDAAAALRAELTLLHAMQQACRDVLESVYYQGGSQAE